MLSTRGAPGFEGSGQMRASTLLLLLRIFCTSLQCLLLSPPLPIRRDQRCLSSFKFCGSAEPIFSSDMAGFLRMVIRIVSIRSSPLRLLVIRGSLISCSLPSLRQLSCANGTVVARAGPWWSATPLDLNGNYMQLPPSFTGNRSNGRI